MALIPVQMLPLERALTEDIVATKRDTSLRSGTPTVRNGRIYPRSLESILISPELGLNDPASIRLDPMSQRDGSTTLRHVLECIGLRYLGPSLCATSGHD
ncbi:hypothetical protein CUC08_Gglean001872 [Alternaria sp. MG1]|nr:hypothetical protein CUC08_Gglean001872 [Alternaria sp. MG1]